MKIPASPAEGSYKNLFDTVGALLYGSYFHYPEKGRLKGEMRLVIDARAGLPRDLLLVL